MDRLRSIFRRGQTQPDRSSAYLVEDDTKYGYMEGDDDKVKAFKKDIFDSIANIAKQITYTPTLNEKLRAIVNTEKFKIYDKEVDAEDALEQIKGGFIEYLINYIKYHIINTSNSSPDYLRQSVIYLHSISPYKMFIYATHAEDKNGNYIFKLDESLTDGKPYNYVHPPQGGSKKSLYKKTPEKVTLGSQTRVVYTNKNGTKFIKQKGAYVLLSKARKQL